MYYVDFIGDSTYSILPEDKLIGFNEKFKEFSQRKSKKLREAINCAKKIILGTTTYEIEREKFKNRTKKGGGTKAGSQSNDEQIEEFSEDTHTTEDNFNLNLNALTPLTRNNGYTNPNGIPINQTYLRKHLLNNISNSGLSGNNVVNGNALNTTNSIDETSSMNNQPKGRKRQKIQSLQQPTVIGSNGYPNGNNSCNGTLMTRRRNHTSQNGINMETNLNAVNSKLRNMKHNNESNSNIQNSGNSSPMNNSNSINNNLNADSNSNTVHNNSTKGHITSVPISNGIIGANVTMKGILSTNMDKLKHNNFNSFPHLNNTTNTLNRKESSL